MSGQSSNLNKLIAKWSLEPLPNLFKPIEKPEFDNPVDEIIYTLEHENDPKQLNIQDELTKAVALEIQQDIDAEIIKTLMDITKGK